MEPVNIHIATQSRYVKLFAFLTRLTGSVFSVDTIASNDLRSVIDKAEKDFAEGKGKVFTIDELRDLTNEVA